MSPRVPDLVCRAGVPATLVLAMLLASPGVAATRKPAPGPEIVERAPETVATAPAAPDISCSLGYANPRSFFIDYIQPPGDSYYVRVAPSACAACASAPGAWISGVGIALEFRAACALPVQVAVVGTLGDSACAPPDPRHLIAGPWAGVVSAASGGVHDFTLPLGSRAPLLAPAYLRVTFTADDPACTTLGTRPRLVTTSSCYLCQVWNYYPADTADLCAIALPGAPVIWAVVDSCVSASLADVATVGGAGGPTLRVWPNPARAGGTIAFAMSAAGHAQVAICDVAGRRVRTLADAAMSVGEHALAWDGRDDAGRALPAGSYLALVRVAGRITARHLVFVR